MATKGKSIRLSVVSVTSFNIENIIKTGLK